MSVWAFFSSLVLHSMKSRMSGCQTLSVCILAARRVLPPDFTTLATASYTRMKLTGPEGLPPPESFSLLERRLLRSVPVPEPNLKSMASEWASRMMPPMRSGPDGMKQAAPCGYLYALETRTPWRVSSSQRQLLAGPSMPYLWKRPTLNQTGELNEPYWCRQRAV